MKKISISFFIIVLISCDKSESISEREQHLINDYHAQIKEERGRKYLFIPKEEVSVIFKKRDEVSPKESKFGDKVIFFR